MLVVNDKVLSIIINVHKTTRIADHIRTISNHLLQANIIQHVTNIQAL